MSKCTVFMMTLSISEGCWVLDLGSLCDDSSFFSH